MMMISKKPNLYEETETVQGKLMKAISRNTDLLKSPSITNNTSISAPKDAI